MAVARGTTPIHAHHGPPVTAHAIKATPATPRMIRSMLPTLAFMLSSNTHLRPRIQIPAKSINKPAASGLRSTSGTKGRLPDRLCPLEEDQLSSRAVPVSNGV
jgi:hypothetical protein